MVVLLPIQKTIGALNWNYFCDAQSFPKEELVREFYANLTMSDAIEVLVHKKKVASQPMILKEADSVDETEKAEFEEKWNNLEPIKEPKVFEPREEPNADKLVEPSIDLKLTIPTPTSSKTVKKSELSIMMDLMKFMHNKQLACWKYAKVRDVSKEDGNASEYETSKEEDEEDK
ncbi:hypothetical protein J1N35_043482 [Gossypium stocksii]|uniref:Uncharacterized protein n=1 Tax=Gossypium stocksii TaxID=47602 RepID=A0A9D3U7I6_9ROSI|nr:hypothetical protein J1N35_043482 [Gossypium stocksii]